MAVTFIRPHRRFAVRRNVRVAHKTCESAEGLLIELSLRGCRISNLAQNPFEPGEPVTLEISGFAPIDGSVRWTHSGIAGLCFNDALHAQTFNHLVGICRAETQAAPVSRQDASPTRRRQIA